MGRAGCGSLAIDPSSQPSHKTILSSTKHPYNPHPRHILGLECVLQVKQGARLLSTTPVVVAMCPAVCILGVCSPKSARALRSVGALLGLKGLTQTETALLERSSVQIQLSVLCLLAALASNTAALSVSSVTSTTALRRRGASRSSIIVTATDKQSRKVRRPNQEHIIFRKPVEQQSAR